MGANLLKTTLWLLSAVALSPSGYGEIRVLAVVNSPDFSLGLPAPGSLATVFVTGLTGIDGIQVGSGAPLPTMLAGVSIRFGALQAPLLAVANFGSGAASYQQINFQVPWGTLDDPVLFQGTNAVVIEPVSAKWGSLFIRADSTAIAQHQDFSLITADSPPRPGEVIVLWGSNFGPVVNGPASGFPAPLDRLIRMDPDWPDTTHPAAWTFRAGWEHDGGWTQLPVEFIGLAPGLVGVYQINIRLPSPLPPGPAQIFVQRDRFCGFFFLQGCGRGTVLNRSDSLLFSK